MDCPSTLRYTTSPESTNLSGTVDWYVYWVELTVATGELLKLSTQMIARKIQDIAKYWQGARTRGETVTARSPEVQQE